jgi:hypothetical protein
VTSSHFTDSKSVQMLLCLGDDTVRFTYMKQYTLCEAHESPTESVGEMWKDGNCGTVWCSVRESAAGVLLLPR